jgi:uncharacterized phage protein gp47/JayE
MPFSRPSLTALQTQAIQDIVSQLTGGASLLRRAILRAVSWAQAGLSSLHYGFLDWIAQQAVPFTATDEFLYAWGALKNVYPKPAVPAVGSATFTGVNLTLLPAGTPVVRADGFTYSVLTSEPVSGGTVTVGIVAAVGGVLGDADSGTAVTLGVAIAGINSSGSTGTVSGGADPEMDAAFRARMLLAYQAPPQGGALADYVEWALATPGVTRAWITPLGDGPGSVVVYPMFDISEAAYNGFPQGTNGGASLETRIAPATGDQLAVANAIYPVRPVTSLVYVAAPVAYPVNVTINGLGSISTATQAAISAALASAFNLYAAVGGTAWPNPVPTMVNGTMTPSQLDAAIQSVPGLKPYTLVAPNGLITAPTGELPVLGTVTYT